MKSLTYDSHVKTKILAGFQICISVPLKNVNTWHWGWHHQMMTKVTFVNSFINTYMALLQNFMLIKSHIETWVWKSTETKLFTSKVLKKSWKVIIKKCDLNTTIPSQCLKINKLQNNVSRIKPNRMKVKSKNNHEEMQLEHPYSLTILKNRCQKIFEMPMKFVFTPYLCNVDLLFICILMFWAPKSS